MERLRNWIVGIALLTVTLILYWPATTFGFVAYDDESYVYENPHVFQGLSWHGLKWSLTAFVSGNWHPLTLVSHMFDCSVGGLYPGGHHLTNIFLHSLNALLLWLLLKRMTGAFWPGALVAALFAWHPLNVESVAWVAERKNVLSTFFLILTIWAYIRYAENPGRFRYGLALGLFLLGLMCKPMLVTLPLLLLLLDYWPLNRMATVSGTRDATPAQRTLFKLILEKIPFLVLSAASSVVTLIAQNSAHAIKSAQEVPFSLRLLNAPVACVTYLFKAVWPARLSILYPLPAALPVAAAIGSLALLAALTALAFHWRTRFRWLLTGWLWFLITLIPVLGIVQAGSQAMADRHAYVAMIGPFIAAAWSLDHWLSSRPRQRPLAVTVICLLLLSLLALTRVQLMHWRDSITLFTRAVAVTNDNFAAHNLLGVALSNTGRNPEALAQFEDAVRLKPDDVESQYHLGQELMDAGKFHEAGRHFSVALDQTPGNVVLLNNLGVAFALDGKVAEAGEQFQRAIRLQPEYPKPYFNYGKILKPSANTARPVPTL